MTLSDPDLRVNPELTGATRADGVPAGIRLRQTAPLVRAVLFCLLIGVLAVRAARAQTPRFVQDRGELINWYYAATFGTGVYTSGDRATVR